MKKKLLNAALLIIVVILWSRIGIDVSNTVGANKSTPQTHSSLIDTLDLKTLDRFVYKSTYRDIFAKQNTNILNNKPDHVQRKSQAPRSRLKLIGVIGDGKHPVAIIENSGVTQYLSVGDSTDLGLIRSIAPDSVVVSGFGGDPEILYLKG